MSETLALPRSFRVALVDAVRELIEAEGGSASLSGMTRGRGG